MSRISLLLIGGALAVASCFVQTGVPLRAPTALVSRAVAPTAMVEESAEAAMSGIAAAMTLISSNAGDFGGYTIPIIGLAVLSATIGILAGPVED
jgi:hypothetical protein